MTVGERIREMRKNSHLTQGELGKKVGCSAMDIARYERGERRITTELLLRLSDALSVPVPYFLQDTPTQTQEAEPKPEEAHHQKITKDFRRQLLFTAFEFAAMLRCASKLLDDILKELEE